MRKSISLLITLSILLLCSCVFDPCQNGHTYRPYWITTKEATCIQLGEKERCCIRCDHKEYASIPKTDHSYDNGTITLQPTCTEKGCKILNCIYCDNSKTEDIPALGHSYDEGTVTLQPTCTEKGVKVFSCTNLHCSNSKTEDIPALGHSYDEGTVTLQPTCTEKGVKVFSCTNLHCSNSKTEDIPALGHVFHGIKCSKCNNFIVSLKQTGVTYSTTDKLSLVLNSFEHTNSSGYNIYSIDYSEINNSYGSKITPGVFKILYYKDSNLKSAYQIGFFNDLYYQDSNHRSYSWKLLADEEFVCLEYIPNSLSKEYIFSSTPTDDLLNWIP